ncbi:hypothetical protein WJX74_000954 [Apatococcus lobatus]|uniref:Protein kinase domain-containing protein n=1 Tax=Apatococcus lobatus TaxID=904363 RepID=A0AAW1RV13_9CHLO
MQLRNLRRDIFLLQICPANLRLQVSKIPDTCHCSTEVASRALLVAPLALLLMQEMTSHHMFTGIGVGDSTLFQNCQQHTSHNWAAQSVLRCPPQQQQRLPDNQPIMRVESVKATFWWLLCPQEDAKVADMKAGSFRTVHNAFVAMRPSEHAQDRTARSLATWAVKGLRLKPGKARKRRSRNLPAQGRQPACRGCKSRSTGPKRIPTPRSTRSSKPPLAIQLEQQSVSATQQPAAAFPNAIEAPIVPAGHVTSPVQTPTTDTEVCSPNAKHAWDLQDSPASTLQALPTPAGKAGARHRHMSDHDQQPFRMSGDVLLKKRSASTADLDTEGMEPAAQRHRSNCYSPIVVPCQPFLVPSAIPAYAYLPWSEVSSLPAVLEADLEEDPEPTLLGEGANGRVEARMWKFNTPFYSAEEPHVAVKLPRKGSLGLASAHAELVREARIGAEMPIHQNLMRPLALLYSDATCQRLAGIVYPLMEGRDLWQLMSCHHNFGANFNRIDRMAAIQGCVKALATMHGAHIAHLDVKPENLLLELPLDADPICNDDLEDRDIKLGDCSMARPLQANEWDRGWHGTPGYRPPEQVLEGQLSQKSDIFAVGMVAAGLVCPAFQNIMDAAVEASGGEQVFYKSDGISPEDLPSGLEALIQTHVEPACEDDEEWVVLIRACLHPLAACRPTAAQLQHWLTVDWGMPDPLCNM